jgi:hypothetical protein
MCVKSRLIVLGVCAVAASCSAGSRPHAELNLPGPDDFTVQAEDTVSEMPPGWADDGRVIDVLVVYTARAEAEMAERGRDMGDAIARAAAQADSAFRNSGIDLRVNVVHHQRVGYVEDTRRPITDLRNLRGADGAEIRALRERYRADQVTVIRHPRRGYNVAVNLRTIDPEEMQDWYEYAYSVIRSDCVDESYRCFVHELGHTLGAGHNRDEGDGPGLFDDSYGYHYPERITSRTPCVFGTVQDYECADDLRILHFSNPGIQYQGHPTGVAGRADNARAINAAKLFVANYHQSRERQ